MVAVSMPASVKRTIFKTCRVIDGFLTSQLLSRVGEALNEFFCLYEIVCGVILDPRPQLRQTVATGLAEMVVGAVAKRMRVCHRVVKELLRRFAVRFERLVSQHDRPRDFAGDRIELVGRERSG